MIKTGSILKNSSPFFIFLSLITLFINQAPHNATIGIVSLFSLVFLLLHKEKTFCFFKENKLFFLPLLVYAIIYTTVNVYHFSSDYPALSYSLTRARWILFAFTIIPALVILTLQNPNTFLSHSKKYIFPLLSILSLIIFYDSLSRLMFSEASASLWFKSSLNNSFSNRASWTYNPIPFSKLAVFAAFIFSFVFLNVKNLFYKYSSLFLSLGMLTCAFLSQTRATWLGLALTSPLILWKLKASRKPTLLVLFTLSSIFIFTPNNFISKRLKSFSSKSSFSNRYRIEHWKANLKLSLDTPLLGVGYASNRKKSLLSPYLNTDLFSKEEQPHLFKHPHNEYIDVLAGMGILALLTFITLLFAPLRYSAQLVKGATPNSSLESAGVLCSSYLIFIFSTSFFDKITSIEWTTILFTWGAIFFLRKVPLNQKKQP